MRTKTNIKKTKQITSKLKQLPVMCVKWLIRELASSDHEWNRYTPTTNNKSVNIQLITSQV